MRPSREQRKPLLTAHPAERGNAAELSRSHRINKEKYTDRRTDKLTDRRVEGSEAKDGRMDGWTFRRSNSYSSAMFLAVRHKRSARRNPRRTADKTLSS
ncbi:hypothetical protein GN956_G13361 [Arapaima gigas]